MASIKPSSIAYTERGAQILAYAGRRRRLLVPVPFAIAEVLARLFEFLPSPALTTGQVDLLRMDNVASGTLPGLQDLDIQPKGVEEVVPSYIGRPHASESD